MSLLCCILLHYANAQTSTFIYTGADQTYTVPVCATKIKIHIWGAGGGGGDDTRSATTHGGGGGYTTGELTVTPGETFTIIVGQGGRYGSNAQTTTYGGGGRGGGSQYTGSGGGRSAIRKTGIELGTAGGGGGGGETRNVSGNAAKGGVGGAGGGLIGNSGSAGMGFLTLPGTRGGIGGSQTAGGAGGTGASGTYNGGAGTQFQGGAGNSNSYRESGGGGGGYYGGGGGAGQGDNDNGAAGGGGGSSYFAGLTSGSTIAGGSGVLTASQQIAANQTHAFNNQVYGRGGNATGDGQNGLVVIEVIASATVIPSVAITASPSGTICAGTSVTFTAAPTNGGTIPTYIWKVNGTAVAGQTGTTYTSTTLSGGDVVSVTMTSNDPCAGTTPVTSNSITVTYSQPQTAAIAATVCSNALPYIFGPQSLTTSGIYNQTFTASNGCDSIVTLTLTVNVQPVVTTSKTDITCFGVNNGSITANVTPAGTYSYVWSPSGGTSQTASGLSAGTYTVNVQSTAGCSASASATITSPTAIILTSNTTNAACFGDNNGVATVTTSGGTAPYTYVWSPSGGNAATASNLAAGTYTINVLDNAGCSASTTVTITSGVEILLNVSGTDASCLGGDGTVQATATGGVGPFNYVWQPGTLAGASQINLNAGVYNVTAVDANGCLVTQTHTVALDGILNAQINPVAATITEGESVNLMADYLPVLPGGVTYNWSPAIGLSCSDCPNPIASPVVTTTYTVLVSSVNNSCTGTTTALITVKPICGELFIPTIFSPNGDGSNDEFKVFGRCVHAIVLKVYNRWGEKVYEGTEQQVGWDGTYKGEPLNTGAYTYSANIIFQDGTQTHRKGSVSLMR